MRKSLKVALISSALAIIAAGPIAAKASPLFVSAPPPAGYAAEKWKHDQAEQEWRAKHPSVAKDKIAETLPPTHTPVLQKLSRNGIDNEPTNGPTFKTLGIKVLNSWHGTVQGQDVHLFAGAVECPAEQGVHCDRGAGIIIVGTRIQGAPRFETVSAPPMAGAVRFVADSGNLLTVTSASGTIYQFDLEKRTLGPAGQ